jgi:hypothetical protein
MDTTNIILSLISGLISGLVVWYVTTKHFAPDIQISEKLSRKKKHNVAKGTHEDVLRIKILNNKRFRKVFNISVYFKLIMEGQSMNIRLVQDNIIPILGTKVENDGAQVLDISILSNNSSKIVEDILPLLFGDKYAKYKEEGVLLSEIFELQSFTCAEFIIYGYDCGTNSPICLTKIYKKEDIVDRDFEPGPSTKIKPEPKKDITPL